eukprot:CCRYP_006181-RA/>CCRYP_006181-RA protein AED:0.28 eAED:0.32 QI:0/0/0/1/0/0/4/0/360
MANEPQSTQEETQHVVKIIDVNYKQADLQSIVNQNSLLELLTEFEELFDGTLGDWNTEPVSLELKEGTKPYHGRAYPVPKYHKETTIKELNRLCELRVVEFQPESEWASALIAALEFIRAYLDDLVCITKANQEDHFDKLKMALTRLHETGLRINAQKSSFCAVKTEYLGYTLTRTGIKPQQKKVHAILAISQSKYVVVLRKFLGMRSWTRCSKVLAPLTSLVGECGHTKVTRANKTKKRRLYWDTLHQKAFNDVKTSIAKDVVLAYSNYSMEFEIFTDSWSKQLGSVITQGNRPLAFFSRKLLTTQQKYSVAELELLVIVETLTEFKGMLWGQRLKVHTDHKNPIQDALGLTSDRVYQW